MAVMLQNSTIGGLPSWDTELTAKARREIEEDIAGHNRAIAEMKIRLNTLIPIARIPSEILSEIFLHHTRAVQDRGAPYPDPDRLSFRHIQITHICHHWREVALNSPRIWSYIDIGPLEATREFLARSKGTLLSVSAHDSYTPSNSLIQVFEAFPRIQGINLDLSSQNYAQVASNFPRETPRLRNITMRSHSGYANSIPFPAIFDKCALPSLENLHIEGYSALWSHPIFVSTITRLKVYSPQGCDMPIDRVFDALQNLQNLQHLDFTSAGSLVLEPDGSLLRSGRQVTFPKLTHLYLMHELSVCAYTLRQMVFPSSATMKLNVECKATTIDTTILAAVIFDKLSGHGVIGPRRPILSAGIRQSGGEGAHMVLRCWRQDHQDNIPIVAQADILIQPLGSNLSAMRDMLKHFGSMIPGEDMLSLYMAGEGMFSGKLQWASVLAATPNLKNLYIDDPDPDYLIEILSLPQHDKDEGLDDSNISLQNLVSLQISATRFPYRDRGGYLASLVSTLESRQVIGCGVKNLEFKMCWNLTGGAIEALKRVVGCVTWDHITKIGHTRDDDVLYDDVSDIDDEIYPLEDMDSYGFGSFDDDLNMADFL